MRMTWATCACAIVMVIAQPTASATASAPTSVSTAQVSPVAGEPASAVTPFVESEEGDSDLDSTPSGDEQTVSPVATSGPSPDPEESIPPAVDASPASRLPSESAATPSALGGDAAPAPLVVQASTGPRASCGQGYAYSVLSNGTVMEFDPGSNSTSVWSTGWSGQGLTSVNGLAVDVNNGNVMYAYERSSDSDSVAAMLRYTPSSNTWERLPNSAFSRVASNSLVAGAVNLSSGTFVFGGFNGATFQIYQWDPAKSGAAAFLQLGYIDTATNQNNGDLAFDRDGNLFVVGSGTTMTVYTITADTLAAAIATPGNRKLAASQTAPAPSPLSSANGIAFRPDGTVYLSNASRLLQVDPTTWQSVSGGGAATIPSSNGASSTDLASCDSPSTLTLRKSLSGRVNASDQFGLSVMSGANTLATATTTGSATGVQSDQIGPILAVQNKAYSFAESAASGALSTYSSSYRCVSAGQQIAAGTGTGGSVTIPQRAGATVVCTITNEPLVAAVTVRKSVQDIAGQNPAPGRGWTLGASTTATTGTAVTTPSTATQVTPASGEVSWRIAFDALTSRANVAVSETMQTGWDFVGGTCTVTPLTGATRTVTVSGATGGGVTGVAPGDSVVCTLTNKPSSATLTLQKVVDNTYGGSSVVSDWTLIARGPQTLTGKTGAAAVTNAVVPPGTYELSESTGPAGYVGSGWVCTGATATGTSVAVAANANVVCTITNASAAGAVTWSKTSKLTGGLLGGSEWTLTGPGLPATGATVRDCIAAPCSGPDREPAPGSFVLDDLAWGVYSATETRAPVGFIASGAFSFTVSAANAGTRQHLGAQVNEQQKPPVLPLAGGAGAEVFLLPGGGLIALTLTLLVLRYRRERGIHRLPPTSARNPR